MKEKDIVEKEVNLIQLNSLFGKVDFSSEKTANEGIKKILPKVKGSIERGDIFHFYGGVGGLEDEIGMSSNHVKEIVNPISVETEDLNAIKAELYRETSIRLETERIEKQGYEIISVEGLHDTRSDGWKVVKNNNKNGNEGVVVGSSKMNTKKVVDANSFITEGMIGQRIEDVFFDMYPEFGHIPSANDLSPLNKKESS